MIDTSTEQPIRVSTDGTDGPYIIVQSDQVDDVKSVLDTENINYSIPSDAVYREETLESCVINLGVSDPASVQKILDGAAIKVSVHFVDGGYQEYFAPQSLIDDHDSLRLDGLTGKALIHELLTDDWGPPPVSVRLEGWRNSKKFSESIPYR